MRATYRPHRGFFAPVSESTPCESRNEAKKKKRDSIPQAQKKKQRMHTTRSEHSVRNVKALKEDMTIVSHRDRRFVKIIDRITK